MTLSPMIEKDIKNIRELVKAQLDVESIRELEDVINSQARMYKSNADRREISIKLPTLDNIIDFAILIYEKAGLAPPDLSPEDKANIIRNWMKVLIDEQLELLKLISKFVFGEPNLDNLDTNLMMQFSEEQMMELEALYPDETDFTKLQKYKLDKQRTAYMKAKKQQTGVGGRRTKKRVQRKKSKASKSRRRR